MAGPAGGGVLKLRFGLRLATKNLQVMHAPPHCHRPCIRFDGQSSAGQVGRSWTETESRISTKETVGSLAA